MSAFHRSWQCGCTSSIADISEGDDSHVHTANVELVQLLPSASRIDEQEHQEAIVESSQGQVTRVVLERKIVMAHIVKKIRKSGVGEMS